MTTHQTISAAAFVGWGWSSRPNALPENLASIQVNGNWLQMTVVVLDRYSTHGIVMNAHISSGQSCQSPAHGSGRRKFCA